MSNRTLAAELARKIVNNTIDYKKFMMEFPEDESDKEINELFDLIEHMPTVGGLFGESLHEHNSRMARINELIAILKKA